MIVPFPPGNAGDITARILGERLAQRFGQGFVVDNRAGATGMIGTDLVAKAAPDGYTLLVTSLSPLVVNPATMRKLPYDTLKDFQPIALIGWTGMMLVASRSLAANTVTELIALARATPGRLSYAHIGSGTLSQLTMEAFRQAAGIELVGVPYKGSSQALADLIGEQVPIMFDGMTTSYTQVRAGKLKALAVSSQRRSQFAPNVPTLAESGVASLKDVEVTGWTALLAPAGTPRAIVERLHAETMAIVHSADIRDKYAAQNLEVFAPMTPDEFGAYLRADLAKWMRVAREAKIELQ
jgi:tripartite-type tricarboxylate transporter receptor subunit TctC